MMKKASLISVVLSLMVVSGCGCSPESRPESRLDAADKLYADGRFQDAAAEYRRALEIDAGSVAAWSGLAEAGLKLGDIRTATAAYERILALDPSHVNAELRLAEFDLLAGYPDRAEERIKPVLEEDPDNLDALFIMADIAERKRQPARAVTIYEEIYERSGRDNAVAVKSLVGLAGIQARRGELEEAVDSLSRAAAIDAEAMEPRLMLFNLYFARQDFEKAEQVLVDLIDTHPDNIDLRLILGRFYYHQREMAKAVAAFSRAVRVGQGETAPLIMAGKFHAAAGNPDEALTMFQQALELAPRDINILSLITEFYLEHGYHHEARKTIAAILDQRPGYFPARLLQIRRAIAEKDYDQAIALGDRLLQSNPASDELLLLKGRAYLEKNDLQQAEKFLAAAVRASPGNIDARIRLADVYLQQGKVDQAQEMNRETIALMHEKSDMMVILGDSVLQPQIARQSPESIETLSRFVTAHPFGMLDLESLGRLSERFDQVIDNYEVLIQKNPTLIRIFESVVLLHVARGEYDIALDKCDRQIERLEEHPGPAAAVYNIKGGLLLSRGEYGRATAAYETAISLAPDFLKPYYGLAKCYIAARDIDSAVDQYRAILDRFPDQAAPHLLLGVLFKMQDDHQAAEKHYRRALALDADFFQAANNLAYLLAERGEKLGEALDLALTAMSLSPEDPYIRDTLGWVYYQKGLYEDAVRELATAVEGLPDNALARYHLGMAHYRARDMEAAKSHLEGALMIDSNFPQADHAEAVLNSLKSPDSSGASGQYQGTDGGSMGKMNRQTATGRL